MTMFHWMRLVIAFCVAGSISSPALAQCEGTWISGNTIPGVSGTGLACILWDRDGAGPQPPVLVVGGQFKLAGNQAASNVAVWDGVQWTDLGGGTNGIVRALLALPTGELIVGGEFTSAGGTAAKKIAKWDGTSWSQVGSGFDGGDVYALSRMPNGDMVAGGSFLTSGSQTLNCIARWNGSSWAPMFNGVTASYMDMFRAVTCFANHNGFLIVGGSFGAMGGTPANNIARWNGVTWAPLSGTNAWVTAMAIDVNGDLIVGGRFSTVGSSISSSGVARWDGGKWIAMGGMGDSVTSVAVLPSGLIVAGASNNLFKNVAWWSGTTWTLLDTGLRSHYGSPTSGPYAMTVSPAGELFAVGAFSTAGTSAASSVARWSNSTWTGLGTGLNDFVSESLVRRNGDVLLAGRFLGVGASKANCLIRWTGKGWKQFGAQLPGEPDILAMAEAPNGDIVVAGSFGSAVSSLGKVYLYRWDGASWTSLIPLPDYTIDLPNTESIEALAFLPNGNLVIGGTFRFRKGAGGWIRNLARWNGSDWEIVGVDINSTVHALAVLPSGDLMAAGTFYISGTPLIYHAARWDGVQWNSLGGTGPESTLCLAVLPNGDVVFAGGFSQVGGLPVRNIARWNGTAWSAMGTAQLETIRAMTVSAAGDLVVGAGVRPNSDAVSRWTGTDWVQLGDRMDGDIWALAFTPSNELIAGGFFKFNGSALGTPYFARWTDTNIPWIATSPKDSIVESGASISLSAEAASGYSDLLYQWQQEDTPDSGTFSDLEDGASPIAPSTTFAGAHSPTLEIIGASHALSGFSFRLIVSNSCGGSNSEPAILKVVCSGDFNNDGFVDDADFVFFVAAYDLLDCADPAMPEACPADLNHDGGVDDADFVGFVAAYGARVCP